MSFTPGKANKKRLESTAEKAEIQLNKYIEFDEIRALKNLKAYVLIFVGAKAEVVKEIG